MKGANQTMKNVVVLGKGSLAIKICEWFNQNQYYNLMYVIPVIPSPNWTESLVSWCLDKNVNWIESGHYKDLPYFKIDLAFSCFYDKIIKKEFIKRCERILNLHNSPLPHYRGVSPINWALKDKRYEHGATIHEITEGIDDGPIVSQVKYSIYPDIEEVIDVYNKAINYGFTLFLETMPIIDQIEAKEQSGEVIYHDSSENEKLGDRIGFKRDES